MHRETVGPQPPVLLEDSADLPMMDLSEASDEEEEEMALGRSAASFVNDALGFAVLGLLDEVDEASVPGDASTGLCALADGASETAATCCSLTEKEEILARPRTTITEQKSLSACIPSTPTAAKHSEFFDMVCNLLDGALSGYAEPFGPTDPYFVEDQVDSGLLPPPADVLRMKTEAATSSRPSTSRSSRQKRRPQPLCESLWEQSTTPPEALEMLPPTPKLQLQEPQAPSRPRMHAANHSQHAILLEPPMLQYEDAPLGPVATDCTPAQLRPSDALDGPLASYNAARELPRPTTRRKGRPMELCEESADIVPQPPPVPRASSSLPKRKLRSPQLDMQLVDEPAEIVIEPPPAPTGGRLGSRGGAGGLLRADFDSQFCGLMPCTPAEASRPPLAPRTNTKPNSKSSLQRTEVEEPEVRQQKKQGARTARRSSSRRTDAGQMVAGGSRAAATSLSPRRHSSKVYACSSSNHGSMMDKPQRTNSQPPYRLQRTESAADNFGANSGFVPQPAANSAVWASIVAKGPPAVFRVSSASPSPGARSKPGSRESSLVNRFRALSASEFHCSEAMEDPLMPATQDTAACGSSSNSACLRMDGGDGSPISAMAQDLGSGNRPARVAAGLTPRSGSSRPQKNSGALAASPPLPPGMSAIQLKKAPAVLPAIRPAGAFKVAPGGSIAWRSGMDRAAIGSWEPRPQGCL